MQGFSREVRREWQRTNGKSWGGKHGQSPVFLHRRATRKNSKRRR